MRTLGNKEIQTAVSRFASDHIRCLSINNKVKVSPICTKCGLDTTSPEHLLDCVNFTRVEAEASPLLFFDFLDVHVFIELV
ncbi:hypothetical protein CDAR_198061 [Caerostris darwini]|uniref:Uncharacterized protein n=1 Tax=Caerostris darwini TaxID=1538125 RepID=A0AAV4RGA7_9ARAC|nr:hypothetical protein CDAR_198061 [Caerostris darwini]